IVQGVSIVFALFNLQGTELSPRSRLRSSRNFYIIPQLFPFVNNFFKFFPNFFSFGIFNAALADSFDIIPPQAGFVKHFMQKILFFFMVFKRGHLPLLSGQSLFPAG
ncbi:MAG: hypothetical protein Q4D50_10610, partial [Eubacteriales bacterium]|nr:hypothetical protein [Eubacteriales bacterium]